jgi:hypothetical protein
MEASRPGFFSGMAEDGAGAGGLYPAPALRSTDPVRELVLNQNDNSGITTTMDPNSSSFQLLRRFELDVIDQSNNPGIIASNPLDNQLLEL